MVVEEEPQQPCFEQKPSPVVVEEAVGCSAGPVESGTPVGAVEVVGYFAELARCMLAGRTPVGCMLAGQAGVPEVQELQLWKAEEQGPAFLKEEQEEGRWNVLEGELAPVCFWLGEEEAPVCCQ